jgi:hypothetical protein
MMERDIPRVWEVDWAIPPAEGGTPWEAYDWLLETADQLGATEVSIVASTYDSLGHLNWAIGASEAQWLRVQPHEYRVGGITVRGVSRRGFWYVRGPVLVAWPDDQVMAEIEGKRPAAIAAVAQWPDDIATWRSVYGPTRIGQVRLKQEAEFDTATVVELDPKVAEIIRSATAIVNENHAVLSTHEREAMAGALIALRNAGIPVDKEALRAYLMAARWQGRLVSQVLELVDRIDRGQTPRHSHFQLTR